MRGPKPPPIDLIPAQRAGLEQVVARYRTPQHLAVRARIILAAADGLNNAQIARQLALSVPTVRLWRQRWLSLQRVELADMDIAARLTDLPRPGAPGHITADQVCQLVALACEPPDASGRPITHWTHREIAEESMIRGIVPQISPRHAGRLLKISRSQAPSEPLLVDAAAC